MRARELTQVLGGRWHQTYGMAPCPVHDDRSPSLSIADGETGRLLLYCHAGCAYEAIKTALIGRVDCDRKLGRTMVCRPRDAADLSLRRLVSKLWEQSQSTAGTQVEAYLRDRAILGPLPSSLRFHPRLRHPNGQHYPAMVGRVECTDGLLKGLHRTYLDPHSPAKAAIDPNKAMLGPCKGAAVRLRNEGQVLVVCEGIETGLSLCDAFGRHHAVWAALSTSGVEGLQLPAVTAERSRLLIAADGDLPGRCAATRLADRASVCGWKVEVCAAPDGRDFNDLAREACHG